MEEAQPKALSQKHKSMSTTACVFNITTEQNNELHRNYVHDSCNWFSLAVNDEVHLQLETHSEVDGGGMCRNDLAINIPQLILSDYIHNYVNDLHKHQVH